MKIWKRAASVGLSLALCAGMVMPSFAANFTDLQTAINGGKDTDANKIEGSDRYGYGWNADENRWGIEAWNDEETGRNIKLNEDVVFAGREQKDYSKGKINITNDKGLYDNVVIDLNGKAIDGGNNDDSTPSGDNNVISVYNMQEGHAVSLTVRDTSEEQTGKITGGTGKTGTDAAGVKVHFKNATFKLESGSITGNINGTGVSVSNGAEFYMTGGSIDHNGGGGVRASAGNSVVDISGGEISYNTSVCGAGIDMEANVIGRISNVLMEGNVATKGGGAIHVLGSKGYEDSAPTTATISNVTLRNNKAETGNGGAIAVTRASLVLDNVTMEGNEAQNGGALWLDINSVDCDGNWEPEASPVDKTVSLQNVTLKENKANVEGDSIYAVGDAPVVVSGDVKISGMTIEDDVHQLDGVALEMGPESILTSNNFTVSVDANGIIGIIDANGASVAAVLDANGSYIKAGTSMDDLSITLPLAAIPNEGGDVSGSTGGTDTEIDEPAVPLAAGPVTRAEFIDYLWRHEGEPETDGVCTFTDVPEDHEYVLVLAWAEQNGVAEANEDGTFEPDELVTVAAVREFLGNFAEVFGMDVDVYLLSTLTGDEDEAVLNCDEVIAEFFGEELADQAA